MDIKSLNDLRPGDIMIAGQSAAPAKLLVYGGHLLLGERFRIGKFLACHAAVVVPDGKLVEAMPHGARIRDMTEKDWTPAQAYFRLPEDYPGQSQDAATMAMAMIGTPYSIASYLYLAAFRFGIKAGWLRDRIDERHGAVVNLPITGNFMLGLPNEAICSVLADQAWTLVGKKVIHGTAPQVVTPGMLVSQLWQTPGVLRGGAGLL